ncbi:MAG: hypothetical protein P1P90_05540 [Patescibacteria group bacterium]|nr:hypothetical protein [Patescibacteria group bacterium]
MQPYLFQAHKKWLKLHNKEVRERELEIVNQLIQAAPPGLQHFLSLHPEIISCLFEKGLTRIEILSCCKEVYRFQSLDSFEKLCAELKDAWNDVIDVEYYRAEPNMLVLQLSVPR